MACPWSWKWDAGIPGWRHIERFSSAPGMEHDLIALAHTLTTPERQSMITAPAHRGKSIFLALISIGLAHAAGTALQAHTYQYDVGDPDHNSILDPGSLGYSANAGYINNLSTSYNPGTERFDFAVNLSGNGTALADSFWLMVSDGPHAKSHVEEYAIFYFDGTNVGAGGDAMVTSYVYSGANSSQSWNTPGMTLMSSLNGDPITASGSVVGDIAAFSFSVDGSVLNDVSQWPASYGLGGDWDGAKFGDNIGVYFHPVVTEGVAYGAAGSAEEGFLTQFDVRQQGWMDITMQTTVPEPSALLLGVIGGMGLLLLRRRRK